MGRPLLSTNTWYYKNKEKHKELSRKWWEANKHRSKKYTKTYREKYKHLIASKSKWWNLFSAYGITKEEYEAMCNKQKGECCICRCKAKLVVDHCHATNKIRGLLCSSCNVGLGHFKDNMNLLQAAINYLSKVK